MKDVYPYSAWKRIDWGAISAKYSARVTEPKSATSLAAWYDIVADLYDGHMSASFDKAKCGEDGEEPDAGELTAGFGIGFTRDTTRAVRILGVHPDVPDIQTWDKVIEVNGEPVETALSKVSLRWGFMGTTPGTTQAIDAERLAALSQAFNDSTLNLTLERDGMTSSTSLTASADLFTMSGKVGAAYTPPEGTIPASCVETKVLPPKTLSDGTKVGTVAYLRVPSFSAASGSCPGIGTQVRSFVGRINANGLTSLIVDLRGNGGGDDDATKDFLSAFARDGPLKYEVVALPKQTAIDLHYSLAGKPKFEKDGQVFYVVNQNTAPTPNATNEIWRGTTVVLVNRNVMSNGDISSAALKSVGAEVIGFEGTAGSASMSGGIIKLPCMTISHTQAQTWDPIKYAAGIAQVQLEANQTEAGMRVGGVTPTINMPRTREMLEGDQNWRMDKSGAEDVTLTFTRIQLEVDSRATDGHLNSSAALRPRRRRAWLGTRMARHAQVNR